MPCYYAAYGKRWINMPASTRKKPQVKIVKITQTTDPQNPIICSVNHLPQLHVKMLTRSTSALWNEYIERYHYLVHRTLPGAQLCYFITAANKL